MRREGGSSNRHDALDATLNDALSLFRRPSLLLRSILSMNVVMVAIAIAQVVIIAIMEKTARRSLRG